MDGAQAAAMRALCEEHAAGLWRYVLRLTGEETRAETVVQETLLWAWQHPDIAHDGEGSARGRLFTVARDIVIDQHRTP
jgi:RNA polymerase sigma-70 factor, ECF subfamily